MGVVVMHGTESAAASGARIVAEASLGGKQLALGFVWPRSLRFAPRASRIAVAVETAISYVTVSGYEAGENPRVEGSSHILYCALHQTPIMLSSMSGLRVFIMAGKNALVRGGHFVHL
jgi:hypothetical protein